MFGLGKHGPDGRYAAIVDIGSASVALAIVASDPSAPLPEIVWTHKERMSASQSEDFGSAAKNIATATMNALLTLGNEGITALRAYDANAVITHTSITIGAPWSYTITKTVSSTSEHPFEITESLVTELVRSAEEQALALIDTNELFTKLGLEVISEATIDINVNGYSINEPVGKEARKISLSRLTGISQKHLVDVARESQEKVLPRSGNELNTFIFQFYRALRNLEPDTTEICLVDISGEATEIGVVRDGVLRYVTHMPFGQYSIAREISGLCGVPYEETLGALKTDISLLRQSLSSAKQAEFDVILTNYITQAADLFKRTGDTLSIPKPLFLHTDVAFEDHFTTMIEKAARTTTGIDHTVHAITSKIFSDTNAVAETKMLLSAFVFHKKLGSDVI